MTALMTQEMPVSPTVTETPLVSLSSVSVAFRTDEGSLRDVVSEVSYDIYSGRTLGVVGESGCGKSMTSLAMLGMVPKKGRMSGDIVFDGRNYNSFGPKDWQSLRGGEVAMIFQEPMTAMNPVMKVGRQIAEVVARHDGISKRSAAGRAIELLAAVGIPSPAVRAENYPHEMSGGMRQRAMIAMALAGKPRLLIADEPTTALDVTLQAQILDLLLELQETHGTAIQFISHNLAVISEISHDIIVMYSGRVVEKTSADALFEQPLHPYTQGLIRTLPDMGAPAERLYVIPGSIGIHRPPGCRFSNRCPLASDSCRVTEPPLVEVAPGHHVACFKVTL